MSYIGGIATMMFIVAAFVTSCNDPQPSQGNVELPSLTLSE